MGVRRVGGERGAESGRGWRRALGARHEVEDGPRGVGRGGLGGELELERVGEVRHEAAPRGVARGEDEIEDQACGGRVFRSRSLEAAPGW